MNFGKSSQIWATMTFTNFYLRPCSFCRSDKTMGVDQVLDENLVSDSEGPGAPPHQFSPSEEFLLSKEETEYGCMYCASNSTQDCTQPVVRFPPPGSPQEGTQMRQLSLQPSQCPFPSISRSGCILCVPPTPLCDNRAWGGFREPSGLG